MIFVFSIRGRSQTTFTRFDIFWPPTPLCLHFLWYKCLQKVDFFDHLPTSSCKRSLWTPPNVKKIKKSMHASDISFSTQKFSFLNYKFYHVQRHVFFTLIKPKKTEPHPSQWLTWSELYFSSFVNIWNEISWGFNFMMWKFMYLCMYDCNC